MGIGTCWVDNFADKQVKSILDNSIDFYADFYLTKSNLRLFIKSNIDLLFEELEKGDKIAYNDKGVLVINGYSDNRNRKYIKILCDDLKTGNKLLQSLKNIEIDLFIKIKKTNPLKEILEENGFEFLKNRGKEVLMIKPKRKEIL